MAFKKESEAKFTNPDIIAEINSLAMTVKILQKIDESGYSGDGLPVTADLDCLVDLLIRQIVSCVPRKKQHALLFSHGLDMYCVDLDYSWKEYVKFASIDIMNESDIK